MRLRGKQRFILRSIVLCLVLFCISSCSSIGKPKNDRGSLVAAVDSFNLAMRWGEYKQAAVWIAPPLHDYFWTMVDELSDRIRIMEYDLRDVQLDEVRALGNVVVRYRYYLTNDPHLETKTLHQQWRFLDKEKVWQLVQHDLQKLIP